MPALVAGIHVYEASVDGRDKPRHDDEGLRRYLSRSRMLT